MLVQVYLDGGLSNNQPVLDDRTIRVNPLASSSHITPKDRPDMNEEVRKFKKAGVELEMSMENIKRIWRATSPLQDMDYLYQEGFRRAEDFIDRDDFHSFCR